MNDFVLLTSNGAYHHYDLAIKGEEKALLWLIEAANELAKNMAVEYVDVYIALSHKCRVYNWFTDPQHRSDDPSMMLPLVGESLIGE